MDSAGRQGAAASLPEVQSATLSVPAAEEDEKDHEL
jgi:hypothetical protein